MENKKYIKFIIFFIFLLVTINSMYSYEYSGYKWAANNLPVYYYINPNGFPNGSIDAINASFQTWQSAANNFLRFSYQGTTNRGYQWDGYNTVSWGIPYNQNAIAEVTCHYNTSTNRLTECDMVFNSNLPFSTTTPPQSGCYDIQNFATHEAGHFVSLSDLYAGEDQWKTMYGSGSPEEMYKRTLHQDDIDGVLAVYTPIEIPYDANNISEAASIFISGQTVKMLAGSYSYSENTTLPYGVPLQINSGVTLSFASGTSLTVNGTLYADGVTFQGNGTMGSWYGIAPSTSASGSINNCTIKDAQYGIHFYNSTPLSFQANTLTNNTTGIFFNNSGASTTLIRDNRIYSNTTGINCSGNSYPLVFPLNKIYDNGTNITISSSSSPDFGRYSDQGHNSIYWGTPYDIYSSYPGTIYAKYSWWGDYPANPYIYGTVDYSNALISDPNQSIMSNPQRESLPVISKKIVKGNISEKSEIPGLKEVDEARGLFSQGKYEDALNTFKTILNNYSDYLSGEISLFFVDECLNILNRESERVQTLDEIIKTKGKKNITGTAQIIQRKYLIKGGKYNEAISNALSTNISFPNSQFEIYSLYDLGSLYWYYLDDKKTGENYYRELIKKYPDDPLSETALATLGEWKPKEKEVEKKSSTSITESSEVLEQNFPNPFNPRTVISFRLPVSSYVKLIVYDLVGREISTLVNEDKTVGKYSVQFNGSKLSSGTYYYRLEITPSDGDKKTTIQKAMVLMK